MFALVIIWAIYLRFWGTWNRSLWMDEAAVANMVLDNSWSGLFRQTDIPVAPLFAAGVKLTGHLIAPPEVGYRLIPIICGILCVPLAYCVMRAMRIPRAVSLAAMALCASSPWLVIWSRELKQYEVEAFTSLALALCVARLLYSNQQTKWLGWAIAAIILCLVSPWFGYGFIFPAFALLLALAVICPACCPRKFTIITAIAGLALMGLSTGIMMKLLSKGQSGHEALRAFMQPWFIDITSPHSIARAFAYTSGSASLLLLPYYNWLLNLPVSVLVGAVMWLFVIAGLCLWPKRSMKVILIWTVVSWGSMAIASMIGFYPFGAARMLVFAALPMSFGMTMGIISLFRLMPAIAAQRAVMSKLTLLLFLIPAIYLTSLPLNNDYWVNQDFKSVLKVLQEKRTNHEGVFVTVDAVQSVRFYTRGLEAGFDFAPYTNGTRPVPGQDYDDFAREKIARYGKRCWLLNLGHSTDESGRAFREAAYRSGYMMELIFEAGGNNGTGKAQLNLLTRD